MENKPLSVLIENTLYTVGDKVAFYIGEKLYHEGIVAFGKFTAEIYEVYGFYVSDEFGNKISEAGLDSSYKIINIIDGNNT